MSWEDILKAGRKGVSENAKNLIEDVMTSKKLTAPEVMEKMIQSMEAKNRAKMGARRTGKMLIPTRLALGQYLNKNYSSTKERRNHPITGELKKVKVYFKEE